jgi:hypothetical protein
MLACLLSARVWLRLRVHIRLSNVNMEGGSNKPSLGCSHRTIVKNPAVHTDDVNDSLTRLSTRALHVMLWLYVLVSLKAGHSSTLVEASDLNFRSHYFLP